MILNELFEYYGRGAPGFGSKGFPGFGQRLFAPRYYRHMAGRIYLLDVDPVIKQAVGEWFANAFERDLPATGVSTRGMFVRDDFLKRCVNGPWTDGHPRYQMRHYYYFAQLIKDEPDQNKKVFICHFLRDLFTKIGEYFMPSRWEDFCGIDSDDREYEPEDMRRGLDHDDRSRRKGEPPVEY